MAFKLHSSEGMGTSPVEYYPGTAGEVFQAGEVLCMTGGSLTKGGVDSAGKQQFICAGGVTAAEVAEKKLVPCYRIAPGRIYSAPLTASGATLSLGDRVTLSADGMGITATLEKGVCEIVGLNGTEIGDRAKIRFS